MKMPYEFQQGSIHIVSGVTGVVDVLLLNKKYQLSSCMSNHGTIFAETSILVGEIIN